MSRSSERMAHHFYYATRKIATLVLQQPRKREDVLPSHYCMIAGKLGETLYRELFNDTRLVLEEIIICQEELRLVGNFLHAIRRRLNPNYIETEKKRRLINHDFLLLKIRPGKGPALYIRAEKVFGVDDEGSRQGTHISVHGEDDGIRDVECSCVLHRIQCGTCVRLDSLIAVLKRWNPYYHVRRDNCWDYARETTKLLLRACMERVKSGRSEHVRLQRDLEQLEAKLFKNHFVNTCLRVVNYAKAVGRAWSDGHVLSQRSVG